MKRCKNCGEEKPFAEFHKEPRVRDGHTAICRACNKAKTREWQKNNRTRYNTIQARWRNANLEKARQRGRDWRHAHPERANASSKKWRINNLEKKRAQTKRWTVENRARVALYAQNRRALERGATGNASPAQLQARIAYYGYRCWCCKKPYEAVDHVIPLARGGSNWPANLRPICQPCNSSKGMKHPSELQPIIQKDARIPPALP